MRFWTALLEGIVYAGVLAGVVWFLMFLITGEPKL